MWLLQHSLWLMVICVMLEVYQVIQNDKLLQRTDRPTIPSSPFFFNHIHGRLNKETANHGLRCKMLSGCMMAPSIPVILGILASGTRTLCLECRCLRTLKGSVWEAQSGPCWARPVDSSLALLSQQEDISWSNREPVDEGRLVSRENEVGED